MQALRNEMLLSTPAPKTLKSVAILASFLSLAACQTVNWAPGPGQTFESLEITRGRCQLLAEGRGDEFVAFGSQPFVASAAFGQAVGNAIKSARTFDACMRAQGFIPAEQKRAEPPRERLPSRVALEEATAISKAPELTGQAEKPKPVVAEPVAVAGVVEPTVPRLAPQNPSLTQILLKRDTCIFRVRSEPRFDWLSDKLPDVKTGKYDIKQLSNEAIPSAEEARGFLSYISAISLCRDEFTTDVEAIYPALGAALEEDNQEADEIAIRFAHQRITWGDWAQQMRRIADRIRRQLSRARA